VIEAQVLSTSSIAGRTHRESDLPEGALVGAVLKGGELVARAAATLLEAGDILVIFALKKDVPEVERLLQVAVEYF
jgi:trk system potassium uptake protein